MHHRPSPVPKVGSGKSGKVERASIAFLRWSQWHHFWSSDAGRWRLWISPWQTMRRAIKWEVSEYPIRVGQHLLPRILTLGSEYSVMMRVTPFFIVKILKPCPYI